MSEPIWKSPGWITALAGLVTAILTIPEIVGDYLTKRQEVSDKKQDSEFRIVSNTLAQQGLERVFRLSSKDHRRDQRQQLLPRLQTQPWPVLRQLLQLPRLFPNPRKQAFLYHGCCPH